MSTSRASSRSRQRLLLRLLLSALFLFIAYETVSAAALLETLSQIRWTTVVLLMAIYTIGQAISSQRWRIFVLQAGIPRTRMETLRAFFFGMFINAFGLGTVGGDLARALTLRPERGKRAAALATVVADRVQGLITLLGIGIVAILLVQPPSLGPWALVGALIGAAVLVLLYRIGPATLIRIFPEGHRFSAAARAAASAFPKEPSLVVSTVVLSAAMHLCQIYMHYIIAQALGAPLSFAVLCATVPLVNTASSLPVTMNGIGLREAMYVLLFVPMGVPPETAVAFGAVWLLSVTLVGAAGGFLLRPRFESTLQEIAINDRDEMPLTGAPADEVSHAAIGS